MDECLGQMKNWIKWWKWELIVSNQDIHRMARYHLWVRSHPWLVTFRCIMVSCRRLACWLWDAAPRPPLTPMGFVPTHVKRHTFSFPKPCSGSCAFFEFHKIKSIFLMHSFNRASFFFLPCVIWKLLFIGIFHSYYLLRGHLKHLILCVGRKARKNIC